MRFYAIAACALSLAVAGSPAQAVDYTTDTASFTGLGDTIGSPFDQIILNSVSGTVLTSGTYLVNTVDFTVGLNSNSGGVYTGTFTNTATADGTPFTYSLPYTITIGTSDSITIGGNSIYFNGASIHFNLLTLASGGDTVHGDLTATVSVPEAASWAMMVAGFGLVGAAMRSRKTAVSFG